MGDCGRRLIGGITAGGAAGITAGGALARGQANADMSGKGR